MMLKIEFKYSPGILSMLLSVALVVLGLSVPWLLNAWMPSSPPSDVSHASLVLSAAVGLILGLAAHEQYRRLIIKMLGQKAVLIRQPILKVITANKVPRWQAIGIVLAPFTDLTLIALIVIAFNNSWFTITAVVTFLTANLLLSARDIIVSYHILKKVDPGEWIQLTASGFQIWTEDMDR